MTNNKHKEIKQIVRSRYSIGGEFHEDGRSGLCITYEQLEETEKELRNFLSSALTEQLEELERWVDSKRTFQHPKDGDEGWDKFKGDWDTFNESIGYHKALDDTLSHIREQKEIINKK